MAGAHVVHRAVVFVEMVEAAVRIDRARVIKRHGVRDVIEQELPAAEIGLHHSPRRLQ
jgi:hypothetical protein